MAIGSGLLGWFSTKEAIFSSASACNLLAAESPRASEARSSRTLVRVWESRLGSTGFSR